MVNDSNEINLVPFHHIAKYHNNSKKGCYMHSVKPKSSNIEMLMPFC